MAADTERAEPSPVRTIAFGRVVIIGGGCYGSYYVRQLRRAMTRGAVTVRELIVVDRDPECAVARDAHDDLTLVVSEWATFFERFLEAPAAADDAVVPSPLMPHLFLHWLRDRAIARFPTRTVAVELPEEVPGVRWQRPGTDGSRYVSFADWMCPVNCIEPRICPHTKGERDWDMSRTAAAAPGVQRAAVLHCTHRSYGVGMIDVRDIQRADAEITRAATASEEARVLVGTVSNCHGALGVLRVGGSPMGLVG
jgi:hypothetical protein